ncbi:hypothetical protein DPMN_112569 [Dreissena polymorpha]|uniref:Uncharacterized protein n=1 Tax=Dreissena polymorpha TaxID=45954 RepID=A0A9D4QR10_DREPO|nr:hypothetical protein DPMN_112569 [Dreissena polymorpha]
MAPWRPYISGTNLLTKFHEDPTINVVATVLTRQIFMAHNGRQTIDKSKRTPPPLETNVLTKFHEDWAKNVSSRLENCPPPGDHVFPPIMTIFQLVRDIYKIDAKNVTSTLFTSFFYYTNKTHVLTKFHEDRTKNVTSSVNMFHYIHIEKTAPPPGGHVFSPIWTIFKLVRDFNETNVLNKFHDDWAKLNTAPPHGGLVFQRTETIFELNQHIIWTNILTKLHEDWASNLTSTVFELSRGINRTNVLTKFHEDRITNVATGVFTVQNVDDARRTKGDHKSSP